VAKTREPLEVEVFIYGSLKNLVIGPRFKIRTKSGGVGQCLAGPDNVQSGISVDWF
jgi:hypothetical protein